MNVSALPLEPMSSPETPKSHSFTWPARVMRMFDGLISEVKLLG